MKRKLFLLLYALLLGIGNASADVMLETDMTAQFNSLATTQWTGSSGQVGWAAPKVTTNSGLTVAAWERYSDTGCYWTGDIMHTTVTGLAAGTYKIELFGAAAFTFGRGFGSEAFTGSADKDVSSTYTENQSITENTGVLLYATTSEGNFEDEIPIWYATNFNTSGIATVSLSGVVVGGNGQITIGMKKTSNSTNWHVVQLKGVTATVSGDAAIAALKATANALLNNATYVNVTGTERTNLQAAYDATPAAETQEAYLAVISGLNDAISAFESCDYTAYDKFVAEKTKATALGVDVSGYSATDAADAVTKTQTIMVDEYSHVTTNYEYGVSLGTWTTVNAVERSGQHWDGTTGQNASTYSEQNVGWDQSSWSCSYSQDITLPAGKYVFKVAGRKSSDAAVLTLKVTKGNEVIGTVNDFPNGDTGRGINTSGATDYATGEGHNYANGGNGRGWEWRYVQFILDDPATVTVAVTGSANALYQWLGFCNATVQTDDEDNVELMAALVALNSAKTAATLTKRTANVGTGVFQYNEATNELLWGAYTTAKSNAEAYVLTSTSTASEVNALATELTTAITNYQSQSLNAPDAEKRYNVSIVEAGKAWDGNAITFIAGGRGDQGNYGVKYLAAANVNLNQALKFTPVLGEPNTYKVSAIRVENGSEQYLTTGSTYEGDNDQIRTTDDASKAMWIKIEPTTTDNQFQLRNMSANKIIANNNNDDMYTAGSANFTIAEASQATPNLTVVAGVNWATFMSPFAVNLGDLDEVEAYKVESVDGTTVEMTAVNGTIDANTPVLLYRATTGSNYKPELSGWGTAASDTYVEGLFTGSYVIANIPVNSYALQKKENVVGFYKVTSEGIQVGANRAYLTVSGDPGAREVFFLEDDATGINTIGEKAATTLQDILNGADVYDLSGRKVNGALEKNKVYIVNGNKIYVK